MRACRERFSDVFRRRVCHAITDHAGLIVHAALALGSAFEQGARFTFFINGFYVACD
jgi:hypothetical protein